MIKVKVEEYQSKIITSRISGHANTAEHGEDLVCAAVSGIVQAALYGLMEYLKIEMKCTNQEGLVEVELLTEPTLETEAILRSMLLGLKGIELECPKALKIDKIKNIRR